MHRLCKGRLIMTTMGGRSSMATLTNSHGGTQAVAPYAQMRQDHIQAAGGTAMLPEQSCRG
jgi:predicted MarR family transcription regulator